MAHSSLLPPLFACLAALPACESTALLEPDRYDDPLAGRWSCENPIDDYFVATRKSGEEVQENPLVGPPWATFYATADTVNYADDAPGSVEQLLFQARGCTTADFSESACSAALGIDGRIGPLRANPQLAITFDANARGWCPQTASEPLHFAGVLNLTLAGKAVLVRAINLGLRNNSPGFADGRLVRVGALQLTFVEVKPGCTFDAFPCEGEILGVATASRISGYPAVFSPVIGWVHQ